jgi:hypothetical protein
LPTIIPVRLTRRPRVPTRSPRGRRSSELTPPPSLASW